MKEFVRNGTILYEWFFLISQKRDAFWNSTSMESRSPPASPFERPRILPVSHSLPIQPSSLAKNRSRFNNSSSAFNLRGIAWLGHCCGAGARSPAWAIILFCICCTANCLPVGANKRWTVPRRGCVSLSGSVYEILERLFVNGPSFGKVGQRVSPLVCTGRTVSVELPDIWQLNKHIIQAGSGETKETDNFGECQISFQVFSFWTTLNFISVNVMEKFSNNKYLF